jgi:Hypervirulence associated proteins TUDOR domain
MAADAAFRASARSIRSAPSGSWGTIKKKITSQITFKRCTVHASKEEPRYLIKSDKTDHMAHARRLGSERA